MLKHLLISLGLATLLSGTAVANAAKLDEVKQKGFINCGVTQGVPGFSFPDSGGKWTGFDTDFCRAVAAAVLGDKEKVKFIPTSAKERFTLLQSGEIDILARQTTWTLSREALGIVFVGVNFYDGQGVLVKRDAGLKSAAELDGASVCTTTGTTTELNLKDFARAKNIKLEPVSFTEIGQAVTAFEEGRCDALSTDRAALAALRTKMKDPEASILLPDVLSQEPLAPSVRSGDDQWLNIVKWVLFATIQAEALGVSQENVDASLASTNPDVRRLLGVEGEPAAGLGLGKDWALQAIKQVGNYKDLFERHLGPKTDLRLDRGVNQLSSSGGLLFAPPIR